MYYIYKIFAELRQNDGYKKDYTVCRGHSFDNMTIPQLSENGERPWKQYQQRE